GDRIAGLQPRGDFVIGHRLGAFTETLVSPGPIESRAARVWPPKDDLREGFRGLLRSSRVQRQDSIDFQLPIGWRSTASCCCGDLVLLRLGRPSEASCDERAQAVGPGGCRLELDQTRSVGEGAGLQIGTGSGVAFGIPQTKAGEGGGLECLQLLWIALQEAIQDWQGFTEPLVMIEPADFLFQCLRLYLFDEALVSDHVVRKIEQRRSSEHERDR